MNLRSIAVLVVAEAALLALTEWADKGSKGKGSEKAAERVERKLERGGSDKDDEGELAREHERRDAEHAKRERAEKRTDDDAHDADDEDRDRVHPRGEERGEPGSKARGDEMRARRDERREIMDEARANHEPGEPQAGKKPWWRFWDTE